MRSQNIKCKSSSSGKVGGISCLLLLLLAFLAINPFVEVSTFAEELLEVESEANDSFDETSVSVVQAEIPSAMSISFSPPSGSASLSPTTSAGQSAQIKVLATVTVQKSGGYSVYVKSNSQNLVGVKDGSSVIPGLQGSATYANIPVNSWGYYATEGSVVPDDAAYKAVSTTGNGDKVTENTSNKITSDTKTIALSFATKINDEKPADTYQNAVTLSVVSSPWTIAEDYGIGNMQEMTTVVCENAQDNDGDGVISGQLKDVRDGKYYWVSKLADGKCWMTQNLDLDLNGSTLPLTPTSSDVENDWMPEFDTATEVTDETVNVDSQVETRSWSLGDVRLIVPTEDNTCGGPRKDALQCPGQFTAYATPMSANGDELAHYILGNHYQWNAATAGTGGTTTSGQAESSICPKGWKLPMNGGTVGGFSYLLYKEGIGSDDLVKLTSAPYYFARSGYVNQGLMFSAGGAGGDYWSSVPSSDENNSYYLSFSTRISAYNTYFRNGGFSVRCIAR